MMVEPNFTRLAINLDQFFPVVRLLIGFVVLYQFELIREPASDKQFVDSVSIVASNFLCNKPLVVLIQGYTLYYAVNLGTIREKVNSAFLVEHSLDAFRDLEIIPVFIYKKLGAPRGRHVKHFFFIRVFFVLVAGASVLAFGIFIGFVFFNHHILPFSSSIFLEVKVNSFNISVRFKVDPEVLMVKDGLNRVVRTAFKLVFAASSWLNKNRFGHLTGAGKNHNPSVDSASAIRIFGVIIRLIIVNCFLFHFSFICFSCQPGISFVIKYGFMRLAQLNGELWEGAVFLHYLDIHVLFVFVMCGILVLHIIFKFSVKRAIHQRLIFSGYGLRRCTIDNKGVITSAN